MKFIVYNLQPNECDFNIFDGLTLINPEFVVTNVSEPSSYDVMVAAATPLIVTKMTAAPYSYSMSASDIIWPEPTPLPAPTSYQTIVSQTGTAAPAVSGGFTPISTYASGTTFTWARTGAGVYTLTASTAVFNTSKTGVFVAPLQNLNASVKAVVTSTTVITVTTAVQSVAVLGLLGLTTTNTDALLNNTMIYVQTYS